MTCYQYKMSSECEQLTAERFAQLIIDDTVLYKIKMVRKLRAEGKFEGADLFKRQLPLLCFHASEFDVAAAPSDSKDGLRKKGQMGRWRLQKTVHLSGLVMLDIDHMKDKGLEPVQWLKDTVSRQTGKAYSLDVLKEWADKLGIDLIHITSSNDGLRFVRKADMAIGNLADNQAELARLLEIESDDAVKDASRGSFCPGFEDIIYINKSELFNYENKAYDEKYGEMYRGGNSAATHRNNVNNNVSAGTGSTGALHSSETSGTADIQGEQQGGQSGGMGDGLPAGSALQLKYGGVTYEQIINSWMDAEVPGWRERAGKEDDPVAGNRHRLLLRLGSDLRYACDKKEVHKRLLQESPMGVSMCQEGSQEEVNRIADDSLSYRMYREVPKRVRAILERAGVRQLGADGGGTNPQPGIDYDAWWRRLQPLLDESPYLREACSLLPPHHRIGGVLASGAMFGTYLTRCWWEHYDGKPMRLSFIVYIIGDAASGKSVIGDIDKLIMAPLRAADKAGREWERQYKEEMKKRAASSKNAKEAAPEQLHPVIRYVPSTISNSQLYTRLTDALDKECLDAWGEPLHLHLYTYEAELATALRAQSGGAWAAKLDLECKSFQNEEAGVDYKNDGSPNGLIQINWNQVITGTPDAMRRKVRKSTVLDGLVTRLALFPMPANDFAMIPRGRRLIQHERDCMLRAVGLDLEKISGELSCERLVDFAYEYEHELCNESKLADDKCMDYFRKRIPLIMIRYALVRAVLRQVKELVRGEDLVIEDSDLEFARLIGDFCFEMQMWMFGNDVMEAKQLTEQTKEPKRRSTRSKALFEQLPKEFTLEDFKKVTPELSKQGRSAKLSRWIEEGALEKQGKKYIKKTNTI